MKQGIKGTLFRIGISFGAIGLILYSLRDKLGEAIQILKTEVAWGWFFLAALTYLCALLIQAVRIQHVLKIQNIILKYSESFYLSYIGLFFNLFFPSAVGGDVGKAFYVYKHSGKKIESMTSVVLDRLLGFIALMLMAVGAIMVFSKEISDPHINQVVYSFLAVMLLVVFFFASRRFARLFKFVTGWVKSEKWKKRLTDVYYAIYNYKNHKLLMSFLILISVAAHCMFIVLHYWLALGLGIDMPLWLFFVLVPVVAIVSMAPSLGGLGVREAGLIYLFSRFVPSERALVLSILVDMVIYGFSLTAGVIYSFRGGLRAQVIHEMEELQ
ncbi:MAG: flippase-like domain-containing protein [Candidatus Omnitrophica bacterium]|nr:flippase-like domain-containing protein [Candidatus Omnitrophota bacterium]